MLTPPCDYRVVVQAIALRWSVLSTRFRTWKRATEKLTPNGWNSGCVKDVRLLLHLVLHQPRLLLHLVLHQPARSTRRYLLPECTWPTTPSLLGLLRPWLLKLFLLHLLRLSTGKYWKDKFTTWDKLCSPKVLATATTATSPYGCVVRALE